MGKKRAGVAPLLVRILLAALVVVTTGAGTYVFGRALWADGGDVLEFVLLLLFVLLFLWISFSFWTATVGFLTCLVGRSRSRSPARTSAQPLRESLRVAIVMPVYNEDPWQTLAGLQATAESLEQTGLGARFDVFVLSDTRDPTVWLEEELAWARLRTTSDGGVKFYYRRRPENIARKSGNIADFCIRWGNAYEYMCVLDADSIMEGATIVEMVRRMEADPEIGLLQTPPIPVNRRSLFARAQQFAASVYGDMFTTGLAMWSDAEGNYWGHNAVIRIRPFMEHCALPKLPGRPPLGGEVLSHDFVEAALLRRAGWKVVIAHDLGGSYEEPPTTLTAFAQRDQRWCQGNLQHLRLVVAYGFHAVSRMHLGMGAMSYLSSPLWLLFLIMGALTGLGTHLRTRAGAGAAGDLGAAMHSAELVVLGLTAALLLLPKLWGFVLLARDDATLTLHGGFVRAGASVLLETVLSVLIAPILMAFHATFVVTTLLGRRVEWVAQSREDRNTTLAEAFRGFFVHTLLGIVAALAVALFAPAWFWWTLPVVAGLILSIPLAMLLGSISAGERLHRSGLLLIPEETQKPPLLQRHEQLRASALGRARASALTRVVVDPRFNALHIAILGACDAPPRPPADRQERIRRIALHGGPRYLTRDHQLALLSDPDSLRWLHQAAWREWPLEVLRAASAPAAEHGG